MLGISDFLFSDELLTRSRLEKSAFTRKRKLPFAYLIATLLSGFKASAQSELNTFFANLDNRADLYRIVSAQAFSQARKKFSHLAFTLLNERLFMLVGEHFNTPLWNGRRVVAADASKIMLFLNGAAKRCMQEAVAFALYLPGLEMTLSWELYSNTVGERQMLFEHLRKLAPNDLLVLDRGYPALWLFAYLMQQGIDFCMRVDSTGFKQVKEFLRSNDSDRIITFSPPRKRDCDDYGIEPLRTTVRLVRVVNPNGQIHVLVTSLLDSTRYPSADFGALYHSRWRIEEAFKRLKQRLALENTSGLTWLAAQQDFGAKIVADNLHALAVHSATDAAGLGEDYKINRIYAFSVLKRGLPRWLVRALPTTEALAEVLTELSRELIRFLPGVSKERPKHTKPHRRPAYKSSN